MCVLCLLWLLPPRSRWLLASPFLCYRSRTRPWRRVFSHSVILGPLFVASVSWLLAAPQAGRISFANTAVVSVDPIASNVGVEILKKGGNAVDAAIATGFALAVTHPAAGNLGGGGFMMIYLADRGGQVTAIDYRETAPGKSTAKMFLNDKGEVDPVKSGVGYLVVGVPGTVRGFWEASMRYGKLHWKAVIEPALKLARDGFIVDEVLSRSLKSQARGMEQYPEFGSVYRKARKSFYQSGETMKLPDLAWTLQ